MNNDQLTMSKVRSLARIADLFANGHAALMPYFPLGFPDAEASLDVIVALSKAGADAFEIGLSFSDPLADGPVNQHAMQVALEQGITVQRSLDMIAELRSRGVMQPFLVMGYINPMMAYGLERFVIDAAAAGADGFIVPDLPPEEADDLDRLCRERGLGLIYFLAPTSTDDRMKLVTEKAQGFIYLVSIAGVTGARSQIASGLRDFVGRIKKMTSTPIAVGFGVSTPDQAGEVSRIADGVIVGSKLVDVVDRADDKPQAAAQFIHDLKSCMR
ncbi:MAG TPA: tryptophan synthase subunit alpha [Anaerolineae bacterium]|nr:tryptophan synthase subunit alpha [Anaerolineae bacterium]